MKWWRKMITSLRRRGNGAAARRAVEAADDQLRTASRIVDQGNRTVEAADEAASRADMFAREVRRSLRLRGMT